MYNSEEVRKFLMTCFFFSLKEAKRLDNEAQFLTKEIHSLTGFRTHWFCKMPFSPILVFADIVAGLSILTNESKKELRSKNYKLLEMFENKSLQHTFIGGGWQKLQLNNLERSFTL